MIKHQEIIEELIHRGFVDVTTPSMNYPSYEHAETKRRIYIGAVDLGLDGEQSFSKKSTFAEFVQWLTSNNFYRVEGLSPADPFILFAKIVYNTDIVTSEMKDLLQSIIFRYSFGRPFHKQLEELRELRLASQDLKSRHL